jgi:PAS domain S-box-containing protein
MSALCILHLEDDPKDAEIIREVLEGDGIGCRVTRVAARSDFVAALEAGGIDLILADFSLPSFDGLSALRIACERCPDVPFIFVSGTLGEELAIDALKTGATDYVLKQRLSRITPSVRRALREARDRAERKEAEGRLRRSEAFLAEGQRIGHTGSWGWVLSTGEVTWSEEQYRMLGLEPGTAKPSLDLFLSTLAPEDRGRVREELQDALVTKRAYVISYRVVLPDGSTRHLRSVGRPVITERHEVDEYIGITSDMTERVQAETALRAHQEMLDLAQSAAGAAAFDWRFGSGHEENRWSPQVGAMHGLAPGTADVSFKTMRELVHPEDWPAYKVSIAHAFASGEIAAEYRVTHADGEVHWLEAKGRMFLDDEGQAARMVGFVVDVTERHHAQEELRRLESRLRQAEKMEALGRFAGGIAHDFNNILGGILGYAEMLDEDAPAGSESKRYVQSVLAGANRARALVDQILAYSRTQSGKRVALQIECVVAEALELVRGLLPAGVQLVTHLPATPFFVVGDPTQLHQVVMNVCINAVQAMGSSGTLRVALAAADLVAEQPMAHGSLQPGAYVRLVVEDTGSGMDDATLARMFEPFFTTREVGKGTGLGLSLVYGIVTDSGGGIAVESEPGRGSTFAIYLPRIDTGAEAGSEAQVPAERGKGERVLVVDDEAPLVALTSEVLLRSGYEPVGFGDSLAALAAFEAAPGRFDAVITDEVMPGLTGTELASRLRSRRPDLPIVLVSGYIGPTLAERAHGAGVAEILKKPVQARELAAALARALEQPGEQR